MSPIPVIIDTDVALDDYMAILYLLQNPAVQVVGITTTGVGASHLTPGTQNALNLLQLGGQPAIPVAAGTSQPLLYSNVFPASWRALVDSLYGVPLAQNPNGPQELPAGALLRDLITSNSPVTILSIGGGTNLGTLFQDQSTNWSSLITRIFMMGGAIKAPGNVNAFNPDYSNTTAEWNIFIDPLGAQNVFGSGVPVTLVPLDASNQVQLDVAFYQALMSAVANPSSDPVARAVATFLFACLSTQLQTIQEPEGSVDGYYFWDPLAAITLTDTDHKIVQTTPLELTVSLPLNEENDTSGSIQTGSGPTIDVALQVDAMAAKTTFLSTVAGISLEQAAALLESSTAGMAARPGRIR